MTGSLGRRDTLFPCDQLVQMEKPQAARHWKEVHRRNESVDSLNDSIHSNRSSLSSGYNKFQFKKNDEGHKKSSIFRFTARNRDNPHDISILTKQSHDTFEHQQLKDNPSTPRPLRTLESLAKRMQSLDYDKEKHPELKVILKDIKFLVNSFKNTIEYFNRQMREIKFQWDLAFKTLQKKQVELQNSTIAELRQALEQQQKQMQAPSNHPPANRQTFINNPVAQGDPKSHSTVQAPIASLAVSEVRLAPNFDTDAILSRNNTLNSLLGVQSKVTLGASGRGQQQLSVLRKAVGRMREVLWGPGSKGC